MEYKAKVLKINFVGYHHGVNQQYVILSMATISTIFI